MSRSSLMCKDHYVERGEGSVSAVQHSMIVESALSHSTAHGLYGHCGRAPGCMTCMLLFSGAVGTVCIGGTPTALAMSAPR